MKKKVTKIVLTGGPCGGKTSALKGIIENFTAMGYQVFAVPEIASIFFNAGVDFLTLDKHYFYNAEKALLKLQIEIENNFVELSNKCEKPALIICDRGAMDIAAYFDEKTWESLIGELSLTKEQLRDERYDAVIHLVTVANGAEAFYSNSSNLARTESPEEARAKDKRLIEVWSGHPNLKIIYNENNTDKKLNKLEKVTKVIAEISAVLK